MDCYSNVICLCDSELRRWVEARQEESSEIAARRNAVTVSYVVCIFELPLVPQTMYRSELGDDTQSAWKDDNSLFS